jgi:hypothetical protein
MIMFRFNDMRMELDDKANVRRTNDGYLGVRDKDIVRIYRAPEEVFKADSMRSFVGKPFTDNHPKVAVNSSNWRDYSRGIVGEDVLRDGEHVRVPMVLMDASLIRKVDAGKVQLSAGYTCDIAWGEGTTPDGQVYDGRQTDIQINHVAVVDFARGGSALAIGDADAVVDAIAIGAKAIRAGEVNDLDPLVSAEGATCLVGDDYPFLKDGKVHTRALSDARKSALEAGDSNGLAAIEVLLGLISDNGNQRRTPAMKTLVVDGITCEMSDTAVEVVQRALKTANDAFNFEKKKAEEEEEKKKKVEKDSGEQIAKLTTELATRDAKITTLEAQVKDSVITPAKLDEMVKDRQIVVDKAKNLYSAIVVDGRSIDDIMKQVVDAKVGAAAKDWKPELIKVSFDTLTIDTVAQFQDAGSQNVRAAFSAPPANIVADSEKRYDKYDSKISDAWKNVPTQ